MTIMNLGSRVDQWKEGVCERALIPLRPQDIQCLKSPSG